VACFLWLTLYLKGGFREICTIQAWSWQLSVGTTIFRRPWNFAPSRGICLFLQSVYRQTDRQTQVITPQCLSYLNHVSISCGSVTVCNKIYPPLPIFSPDCNWEHRNWSILKRIQSDWTVLAWFSFWWTDQWASPLVVGWHVRARGHVDADAVIRWCLLKCITACPLVGSSKTSPCQFSSVTSLCVCLYSLRLSLASHCLAIEGGRLGVTVKPPGTAERADETREWWGMSCVDDDDDDGASLSKTRCKLHQLPQM